MLAAVLAAISVAFPQEGQRLPSLTRCYMIGATDGAEQTITVRGCPVPVSRTGAWATVVDVKPGLNVFWISGTKHTFFVGPGKYKAPTAAGGRSGDKGRTAARASASAETPSSPSQNVHEKLTCSAGKARPHPKGKRPSDITIYLDAGHGGVDTGAVSPHGLPEKDANLRLAKAVEACLKKRGFRVKMTRTDDKALALYDRPKAAHTGKADAFVSIHHNAPGCSSDPMLCRYQSVYAWNALGERLAKAIERRMSKANPTLASKGVNKANFAVTRSSEIPSCLIEADFVTHPAGESAIWDASRREPLADAIAAGIADWAAGKQPVN